MFELPKGGALTALASFTGANGAFPADGLIAYAAGDLFGTAVGGGANDEGVVFELPKGGALTVLASFTAEVGAPHGGLIADAAGNLFGTIAGNGANTHGSVFEVLKEGSWYAFAPFFGPNGAQPVAGLIAYSAGNLFGTTLTGGANDDGVVFEVSKIDAFRFGAATVLDSFDGANGSLPSAGLIADAAGNLFGTAGSGGADGNGTIFEITGAGFAPSGVSESATWVLMLAGFGLIGAVSRRRRPAVPTS